MFDNPLKAPGIVFAVVEAMLAVTLDLKDAQALKDIPYLGRYLGRLLGYAIALVVKCIRN